MRPLSISVISLSVLMLASCGGPKPLTLTSADGSGTVTVQAEVADNPDARNQGLMNRTQLAEDAGMLFVFPEPQMLVFWMKNTKIPLDIMFFDAEGRFTGGIEMQPCLQDPCPRYAAPALSKYALEANKGFRAKHGIGMGWKLDLKQAEEMSNPS
jgi:uncharacterized protein